jgi:hypothetical protein
VSKFIVTTEHGESTIEAPEGARIEGVAGTLLVHDDGKAIAVYAPGYWLSIVREEEPVEVPTLEPELDPSRPFEPGEVVRVRLNEGSRNGKLHAGGLHTIENVRGEYVDLVGQNGFAWFASRFERVGA